MNRKNDSLDLETKIAVVREWLATKWAERYPSISPDYDPELRKPIFGQAVKGARDFTLATPLYEEVVDGIYYATITSYNFTRREAKFLKTLGARKVRDLFKKTDCDVCKAGETSGMGERMIRKILDLRRECHELAKELNLVKKDAVLESISQEMLKKLSLLAPKG